MPSFKQSEIENPHFQLPFRFGGCKGGAFVNEEDSSEEIIQCIEVLLAYPIGAHPNIPGFGTPDVLFKSISEESTTADMLREAILQWEGRASIETSEGTPLLTDELIQQLTLRIGVNDG